MGTDEHDTSADLGGIEDTGDLGRIWDELERIAGTIDDAESVAPADRDDPATADGADDAPGGR